MRRRDLLGLVGGGLVLPPFSVAAQQSKTASALGRVPRIGFIAPGSQETAQGSLDAFREDLRPLGSGEDSNPVIVDRWAEGQAERLPGLAKQLIGSQVDALVTVGSAATLVAKSATSRVPIVFVAVADPVGQQIVSSLARPGGNATGLALDSLELITTRLRLLKEVVPRLGRLAVIVRNDPGLEQRLLDLRRVAEPMAIKVREFEAPTGGALQRAFMWLVNDRSDAIYVASGPLGPAKRADIIALAAKARIPAIYPFRAFPAAGGLMSFGTDEKDLFRRAAIMVDKILKGSKPSELPVEQPTKFELIVNLSTAKALGLTLPESILAQANEVIE
jgi:ABC-type uncharacterized transport system substrate-binding protein